MNSESSALAKSVVYQEQVQLFSIAFHMITLGIPLLYDLYVNFSPDGKSNKFIRIFPRTETIVAADLERIQKKYPRVYILEIQRDLYLQSLVSNSKLDAIEKSTIIKDSAIRYLDDLFDKKRTFNTDLLNESVDKCHAVVESMVSVIQDYSIDQLQEHIAKLSFHDFYTYDHSINVSMYCISFYRFMFPDAPDSEVVMAGLGGMLHDLGKVRIATSIINNPGKLSAEEFAEMRKHPDFGKEIMQDKDFKLPKGMMLSALQRVVNEHHENWDGSGYPNKIQGEAIHFLARVTSICDFFDAITTKRAYSKPLPVLEALGIMAKTVDTKIDKKLFESFCTHVKSGKAIPKPISELDASFDPCMPHASLPLKGHRIT